MKKPQSFRLLHISDIHINADENFDRSVVLDPLLTRSKADKKDGFSPEIIVVTGDIAYKGIRPGKKHLKGIFEQHQVPFRIGDQTLKYH